MSFMTLESCEIVNSATGDFINIIRKVIDLIFIIWYLFLLIYFKDNKMFGFIKNSIDSTCNIVSDVTSGELPSKKDLYQLAETTLDVSLGITAITVIKDLLED